MQDVHAVLAVNWAMNAEKVVATYQTIGDEDDVELRILVPAVNEVMKAAVAKRTAEEVLTKRLELKKDIDEGLKERLTAHGLSFYDVSIVNVHFSPEFSKAIESKQIAEQQAKQAEYTKLKAIQDAGAEIERAKGQAAAQNLIRSTMTSEILQQRAIEKWDGHFPQVMGSNTVPFLDLQKMKQ